MSWREQYEMYSAFKKDVIIGMLIECNKHLQSRKPTIEFVAGSCGFYNVGIDTSGRCINCGKQQWEH